MSSHSSSSVLAHHFDNLHQQRSAMRLGMWMFLVTELLFFGGIFCAYTVYRIWYPVEFELASSHLNVWIASINSILLLTSSLTITLAIHAGHSGKLKKMMNLLLLSAFLGTAFLGFKAREYYLDFEEHLVPGEIFKEHLVYEPGQAESSTWKHPDEWTLNGNVADPARIQLFFAFYYVMTGLHVVHLIVGVGLILYLWCLGKSGYLTSDRALMVEITSLYWHFVDLIWLFLMPLLYLAGSHAGDHFHL